ncbi:MAG TPA: Na+/H+ antiporter NhaC family protein [Bacillales bacterium]|nr:Na+/H+ antiporter NhaC family protein [Bacillales bacterium]
MQDTWLCLIPFLIVIPISMLTKQVQPGLFIGLLVGSYLMYPSLLGGVEHMINYLVSNVVVKNNIRIIIFLYGFAGLVGMIKFAGGIKGFVHMISGKVKSKKSALMLAWVSTLGTFSEPDFRIVTIGSVMKEMIKRLDMSKKKVGYAIEFTANPVIAMIPIATAFVGYMVSVIGQALKAAGVHGTPYMMYVKSIPFNFFSITIVLVGIYYSFIKKSKEGEDAELEMAHGGEGKKKKSEPSGGQPAPQPAQAQMQQGGGQPAYSTEMGSEMQPNGGTTQPSPEDTTQIQAHLTQAQIDLAEAEVNLKQAQQNGLLNGAIPAGKMPGGNQPQGAQGTTPPAPQTMDPNGMQSMGSNAGSDQQPADNTENASAGMSSNPADIPQASVNTGSNTFTNADNADVEMASDETMDLHGNMTGVFQQPQNHAQQQEDEDLKKQDQSSTPPHADQQEDLDEAHRAYKKDTPIRPWNLILPIGLFLALTLFLSWWDGHTKANSFFGAFIKSDMLGVMLTSLLTAIIVAIAYFIFQKFSVSQLATHFIKGGNELLNVIVMLSLIWALTAVSEDLGFSHYISGHVKGWIPHMFIAPSLFVLGVIISYFIGSSWGTWGLLMPLGVTLAAESHTSVLLAIGAVFASGTFGAFCSPLSDNTVTTCTVLGLPVTKYARSKLAPALIAAGASVILFGVFSFIMG